MSVWLFDQESLVSPYVADALGREFPLLHLKKYQDNGIYDRFTHHVDWLWNNARQP